MQREAPHCIVHGRRLRQQASSQEVSREATTGWRIQSSKSEDSISRSSIFLTLLAASSSQVLLQTAKMKLITPGANPRCREVRPVLDTGSQRTYISEEVARYLHLPARDTRQMRIQTFGKESDKTTRCNIVEMAVQTYSGRPFDMEAMVVPFICEPLKNQSTLSAKKKHKHLRELKLSDPTRKDEVLKIDLLVGLDYYWSLVTGNIRKGKTGPTAIQTRVGWVLSGVTGIPEATTTANLLFTTTHLLATTTTEEDSLDKRLKTFWHLASNQRKDLSSKTSHRVSSSSEAGTRLACPGSPLTGHSHPTFSYARAG